MNLVTLNPANPVATFRSNPKSRLVALKRAAKRSERRKVQATLRNAFQVIREAWFDLRLAETPEEVEARLNFVEELTERFRNKAEACQSYLGSLE
jgi:hypothetical protein